MPVTETYRRLLAVHADGARGASQSPPTVAGSLGESRLGRRLTGAVRSQPLGRPRTAPGGTSR
jgi:hypothetical protein